MAGVLGGGCGECHPSLNSCMVPIRGRIRATHRERGTRWSARDRRPRLPALPSFLIKQRRNSQRGMDGPRSFPSGVGFVSSSMVWVQGRIQGIVGVGKGRETDPGSPANSHVVSWSWTVETTSDVRTVTTHVHVKEAHVRDKRR